jgi:hypothetical protein
MLPPLDVLRLDAGSERGAAVAIAGAPVSEDTGATAGANWPAFAASSSWLREMSSKVRSRLESCSMDDIAIRAARAFLESHAAEDTPLFPTELITITVLHGEDPPEASCPGNVTEQSEEASTLPSVPGGKS